MKKISMVKFSKFSLSELQDILPADIDTIHGIIGGSHRGLRNTLNELVENGVLVAYSSDEQHPERGRPKIKYDFPHAKEQIPSHFDKKKMEIIVMLSSCQPHQKKELKKIIELILELL